jgi:hypothetical protein
MTNKGTKLWLGKSKNMINKEIHDFLMSMKESYLTIQRWPTKSHLIQFSTHASMTHQQPINTCHISTHLASPVTSSCMVKKMYLTHVIFILNSVFITIVFFTTRWNKLDHACLCFEEFLNQLNLLYKYRISIYVWLITQKNL